MLWLLQNNYVQAMTGRLARALHHTGRTLLDFSIKPCEDFPLESSLALTPHFCYGSTGMLRRLRKSPSWCTGIFGTEESLDQRYWQEHLSPLLLNPMQEILTFEALSARPFTQPYFIQGAYKYLSSFLRCLKERAIMNCEALTWVPSQLIN